MDKEVSLNPNQIVSHLNKPSRDFTRADIMRFIEERGIRQINFRYVGGDGRLKTLNFVINNHRHLEHVLSTGERVDGSSLFSYISATSSDLYVVPRFRTAFVNPFNEIPTIDMLCSYFTSNGEPLESAPESLVYRAHDVLKQKSGVEFQAMGELEYYLISEIDSIYPIVQQKGYHESHPFSKWGCVRREALKVISEMGGSIKYGHAEVGNIIHDDQEMVQHEIEFLPEDVEVAADQLVLAKWAIREIAYKYGLEVSFAPKIIVGHAGSGMHVHTRLLRNGESLMVRDGRLSDDARRMIAGFLTLAPSLTAFGNTVPTSFLRLVPHQEAPTAICWGDRNRSVLVRVPLGWLGVSDMIRRVNPLEPPARDGSTRDNQTVELRSPDGSANVHQLLAGMAVAVRHGLENPDALNIAEKLYVSTDASKVADLEQLPASCYEAAQRLLAQREIYEKDGVFPADMIDKLAAQLKSYDDKGLSEKLYGNEQELKKLVSRFIHCG
ncbi:MAG: glutamine synthetase [Candidatus Aminicenantes bacterium]|nr:glutamine synthetase [Candidatus Aminicenantes bacterium]